MLVGNVEYLLEPEFFALVEVGAARQGQHEQRAGPRATQAQFTAAETGGVPGHVVVGQHPGGGGADIS